MSASSQSNKRASTTCSTSSAQADSQQRQQKQEQADSSPVTARISSDLQQHRQTAASSSTAVAAAAAAAEATGAAKTLHSLLGISEHMELSQIELIYRAEGNANLVLALPQFKKVLRLPKTLPSSVVQQRQRQQEQQQQPQKQQHRSTSDSVVNQNAKAAGDELTMPDFVAYIEIIRQLQGNEHIFEADIVSIPREADRLWINEHIRVMRPAHRLDKEFCGQFGLLLPDATQLPIEFDILLSNLQPRATLIGSVYAIEIKPKQGWLFPSDVNNLFHTESTATMTIKTTAATTTPTTTPATIATPADMQATKKSSSIFTEVAATTTVTAEEMLSARPAKIAKIDTRCRYCAMQSLKLKKGKILQRSAYCPMELFSGMSSRMLDALQALLVCPQNNLRIFENGNLIYGDHASSIPWSELRDGIFSGDKLELIKHLLVTCLLRDYGEIGAATARASTGGAAGIAKADVVVKAVAGQPHSSATVIATVAAAAAPCPQHNTTMAAAKGPETEAQATQAQINEVEMLCLPKNCVLQKILHLQLLAKRNLRYMFELGHQHKYDKSYAALRSLLQKHVGVSFEKLQPTEEYLLGATAMDCSIMLTFQQISSEIAGIDNPHVVHLPAFESSFLTKITLVDLDPKPDSHFAKYLKQTRDAYNS